MKSSRQNRHESFDSANLGSLLDRLLSLDPLPGQFWKTQFYLTSPGKPPNGTFARAHSPSLSEWRRFGA